METDRYAVDPSVRALLADLGVSPAVVLRRAGLPTDLFSRGQASLPTDEYHALWRAVEDEYAGEHLPLAVARALSVEVFHPPIFAAMCSPILASATDAGPARQVGMPVLPDDAAAYEEFLGCRVRKEPAYSVSFSALDAARSFLTANEAMWERFEPSLRSHLSELEAGSSTGQRVRAVLLELLPAGSATMQAVARELTVSTRTLQRRLHAEGTSFQAVLNQVREELARHYLADPSMSVAAIAFLLGYQDQSSFYRAFSSWTGHTPELLRTRAG